jgi:hypothetical protein
MPAGMGIAQRTNEETPMRKKMPFIYFCWMRVLPATGESTIGPQQSLSLSLALHRQGEVGILSGPRPPKVTSKGKKAATPLPDHDEYWYADEEYHGDPTSDTVIDYGPAFIDRDEAIVWLSSSEGQTWAGESSNYLLFTFELDPTK